MFFFTARQLALVSNACRTLLHLAMETLAPGEESNVLFALFVLRCNFCWSISGAFEDRPRRCAEAFAKNPSKGWEEAPELFFSKSESGKGEGK